MTEPSGTGSPEVTVLALELDAARWSVLTAHCSDIILTTTLEAFLEYAIVDSVRSGGQGLA